MTITDENRQEPNVEPRIDPGLIRNRSGAQLAWALFVLGAVWTVLFVVRVHAHQANVDDYLYAVTARGISNAADPLVAVLHTGQNAPLVLVLALPGVRLFGVYGAMAVELPLLLLLGAGSYVLARRWLSPFGAAITTLAVGLNAAVLGYSVMLNFALASTAAVVWCFATYVRSERLTVASWSVGFGFAYALLMLSRSVAPVYAAPLALLVAADVVLGTLRNQRRRAWWPAVGAVGTILVVAGPWWLASGREAVHYLRYAGYQAASGYTTGGIDLSVDSVARRTRREVMNMGQAEALVLGLVVMASLVVLILRGPSRQLPRIWLLVAWVIVTLLILSSSDNTGTAFGLPLIAVTLIACAAVLGTTVHLTSRWFWGAFAVLLLAGAASQLTSSTNSWWRAPAYRLEVVEDGGTNRTNVDLLTQRVASALGPGFAVTALNSALLNFNGLTWYASPSTRLLEPLGVQSTQYILDNLHRVDSLVTGNSLMPYNAFINEPLVESAAFRDGLRPVRRWVVSKDADVVLWKRSGTEIPVAGAPPSAALAKPRSGAVLRGSEYLLATAKSPIGISGVTILVTGSALQEPLRVHTALFYYGYIGVLDTASLRPGSYIASCVAETTKGTQGRCPPVPFTIGSRDRGHGS